MTSILSARRELIVLTGEGAREIALMIRAMRNDTAENVRDMLIDQLPIVGDDYQMAAGSMAADWYDEIRDSAGARKAFTPYLADLVDDSRWESLAKWAVTPLFTEAHDVEAATSLVEGGFQRTVANAHRETITGSSIEDTAAKGWARYGVGANCDFCNQLITRGGVYSSSGVEFEAHDRCNCIAAPVFDK